MKHSEHCNLCNNEITIFEKGIICGVTKKKPNFEKYCSNFKINENIEGKLENANLKLKKIQRKKHLNYLAYILLICFGFILIIKSGTIAEFNNNETYFLVHKVGIIAIGITILINTIQRLSIFRKKMKSAKLEKGKIDSILNTYGINCKNGI